MIAGVNMSGELNALYPKYNANRINPVKKPSTVGSNDSLKEIYESEEKQSSLSVSNELKNATKVSYTKNPYEQSRKMADCTLLVGQNFDIAV